MASQLSAEEKWARVEELEDAGRFAEEISVLKDLMAEASADHEKLVLSHAIVAANIQKLLPNDPMPGTAEYVDIRNHLRIMLSSYERCDAETREEFEQESGIKIARIRADLAKMEAGRQVFWHMAELAQGYHKSGEYGKEIQVLKEAVDRATDPGDKMIWSQSLSAAILEMTGGKLDPRAPLYADLRRYIGLMLSIYDSGDRHTRSLLEAVPHMDLNIVRRALRDLESNVPLDATIAQFDAERNYRVAQKSFFNTLGAWAAIIGVLAVVMFLLAQCAR